MFPVRFHPRAEEEIGAAAEWYESRQKNLGKDFLLELGRAATLLSETPHTWAHWPEVADSAGVRRFLLSRFPYGIAYQVLDNAVVVLAVAHLSRRPGYWKDRLA